jgi:NADPH2:quinone reductase
MIIGAYADRRLVAADRLVPVPEAIDDVTAAAVLLKGMTAEYLLRRTVKIEQGQTILVHAAAGGVGLLLCQWANALGATVIGTVGSSEKATLAVQNGCDHVINYRTESFVERVREITGGHGVDVVYDSVGPDTFMGSLDAVRRRGMVVTFGQSSGPMPEISPLVLSRKGSLYLTRPTIADYIAERGELLGSAEALFDAVASGTVKVRIDRTLPLAEAARAHRALEARETRGSVVLMP